MKDRRRTQRPSPPVRTEMPDSLLRPGVAAAMRLERDHLFDSGHFSKAPTLMRLLAFLIEQTLAGKGEELKSYSVAVDGLGRDPDFDTQADSYPRVQVVRLRKMLESFYARHEPVEHLCIYLRSGSYRIRLGPLSAAYPELVRSHPVGAATPFPHPEMDDDPVTRVAKDVAVSTSAIDTELHPVQKLKPEQNFLLGSWRVIAGVLLLLAIMIVAYTRNVPSVPGKQQTALLQVNAPILLLERVNAGPDPRSIATADGVYALLADAIGRSWLVRLRLASTDTPSNTSPKPNYLITVQLGEAAETGRPLYLRLTDYKTSNLLWSTSVNIKPDTPVGGSLAPAIAQLTGPFGVIAARETRRAQGSYGPGYSCLLGYLANVVTSSKEVDENLSNCLQHEIEDAKLDAVRLAFQSFHMMKPKPDSFGQNDQVGQAIILARQSIKADPKEAYTHFAMARIHFVSGNCPVGRLHSNRAIEANPYDPLLLAILGNFAATCGYTEGIAMLEKAYAFRSPGDSHARLSLILAAIWQKRLDRLELLRGDGEETDGNSAAYHYLCETLIAAAHNEIDLAQTNWRKFKASPHARKSTNDAMLGSVIMSPEIRIRILQYLKSKNVI